MTFPSWQHRDRGWRILLASLAAAALIVASTAWGNPLRPRGSGEVVVSRGSGPSGKPITAAAAGTISASGRYATFTAGGRVFVRDLRTNRTRRVDEGGDPVISADGRHLAYTADGKVFGLDLRSGARSVVSRPLPFLRRAAAGSGFSSNPSISADGRYVAFQSYSRGLVDEDGDRRPDASYPRYQLFLRDMKAGTTTLISRGSGAGAIGDGESSEPALSANGHYVAFTSEAGNLVSGASPRGPRVYVRNLGSGRLLAVPSPERGSRSPASASGPVLSASGRFVAMNVQPFGAPPVLVVHDLRRRRTVEVSHLTPNRLKIDTGLPGLSSDGRLVAFRAGPAGRGLENLYVADLLTRRTRLVHPVSTSEGGRLSFSANGRFLLFDTYVEANVPKGSEPLIPASGEVYRLGP